MTGRIGAAGGRSGRIWSTAPYHLARYSALCLVVICIGFVALSLAAPQADTSFRRAEADTVSVAAPQADFSMPAGRTVTFGSADGGAVSIAAGRLAEAQQTGEPDRLRLAAMLAEGPVRAEAVDSEGQARAFSVATRAGRLSDTTGDYWVNIGCSLAALLFALAIWASRPRDWAAACFAWIGVFFLGTAFSDGLAEMWNIATPGWYFMTTQVANTATLQPFAIGFMALFARFPQPLFPRRVFLAALAGFGALGLAAIAAAPFIGVVMHGALQVVEYTLVLALVVAQVWVGRKDPAQRAPLIILLASISLGTAGYFLMTVIPTVQGVLRPPSETIVLPINTLIFVGIGMAVLRTGLLAMEGWVRSLLLSVCFLAAVLVVDIGIVGVLVRQNDVALGLSFAAVALVYFPLREWLSRRVERRRSAQIHRTLRLATDLAFATSDEERAGRWRAAIEATFQPLEIAPDLAPVAAPALVEGGAALRLPPLEGAPGLICRNADSGRRLFGPGDVEAAEALIAMVRRLVEARDAYVAGAAEERQRIARDLHDDVSGRLMTSLHRSESALMRQDVREAMADIRTIISGLAGKPRLLGELLADLRHECLARCQAAGVALDWPPGPELADQRPLDYALYRHLTALVRESVSNLIRHSGASRAVVEITLEGDRLSAAISDNGRGMAPGAGDGHGLRNCAQRAAMLGGTFEVLPAGPEGGCAVRFAARLSGGRENPSGAAPQPAAGAPTP